jgi:hypothetical protein
MGLTRIPSKEITYPLDTAFTKRVPWLVDNLLVTQFNGTTGHTMLRIGPQQSGNEQTIRNKAKWENLDQSEIWIVNSVGQAGKTLTVITGKTGVILEGGALSYQLEDSSGSVINPSTEDKQDDLITEEQAIKDRIGAIAAGPVANSMQDRLKTLNTNLVKLVEAANTPTVYHVTITNADQEYSQALPANLKRFSIHLRDWTTFRFAYVTGKVAGPAEPYLTIPDNGEFYHEGLLHVAVLTLYFASPAATKHAEIEVWT